ncbi:hypothetical protein DICPUDRAFT_78086 [Dictyostelium purpureum]|uniref:GATA-type domain-containing protein n=1 Tax=Dictyostelium purpureum TaxID=5786 RepID=F0ZII7_DICPU|nr:uncharacterized protein DICPUDRAFT_78086 [Dictyostelium purpureum]EGC36222.1 hypothetical protein DICPUDRAFT_78086 [Dictyostelium purpureum]|eukprot:XP_003287231.1 hypothetical protein DICPUDRAFT_78086 [Dictyostelium purpureum]
MESSNTKKKKPVKVNKIKRRYIPIDSSLKKKEHKLPETVPKFCRRCEGTNKSCKWRRGPVYYFLCDYCHTQYKNILEFISPGKTEYEYLMYSHIVPHVDDALMTVDWFDQK